MYNPDARRPLVSCVIIFLNGEKYIAEAIESVLAQTFSDWELILVDDGTTDGATAIAQDYAVRHPGRIFYTDHPGHENHGMSAARNRGVAMARGRYVAFLDADDIWLPNRLARHVEVLERHPEVAMSVAPTLLWSSWNRAHAPAWRPWLAADMPHPIGLRDGTIYAPPDLAIHYLDAHGGGMPGICSLTIRREAILEVGGFNHAFRRLYEDQVMLFKIFLTRPVIAINQVLDHYRQHPESACSVDGRSSGDKAARPVFLEWLQSHLVAQGVTDPEVWRALRGQMLRLDNPLAWKIAHPPNWVVETWNAETRQAVIWFLTPRRYDRLRRLFGLKPLFALHEP